MRTIRRRASALRRRERLANEFAEGLETHRLMLAERLRQGGMDSVRDVPLVDLAPVEPTMFSPHMASLVPALLMKNTVQPAQVRAIVQRLDGEATVTVGPLSDALRQSLQESYVGVVASWLVGTLALILAVGGVFGVFSYLVEERTREIGIRVALGARRSQILALLFGGTRTALLARLATALVLSFAAGQALRAFLFGLSPFDPVAYMGAATLLAVAAVTATIIPARRAMRVDPVVALRHD